MNYINKISIYGLMNKNCLIDDSSYENSFWKNKSKTKLVKLVDYKDYEDILKDNPNIKQISYMYLDKSPDTNKKFFSSCEQIESIIDKSFLRKNLTRKNHREVFETVRKFDKVIYVEKNNIDFIKNNYNDILKMIEEWRFSEKGGMKYGFIEHAGIDKACFKKLIEDETFRNKVDVYIFLDLSKKIVGYSMIEKSIYKNEENLFETSYLIRKCLVENRRNLTEYIDWYTFNETMEKNSLEKEEGIVINWGCSSGGVAWYKKNKWPIYKLEKKWFSNLKIKK